MFIGKFFQLGLYCFHNFLLVSMYDSQERLDLFLMFVSRCFDQCGGGCQLAAQSELLIQPIDEIERCAGRINGRRFQKDASEFFDHECC